jgi:hypothetical protein
VGRIVAGVVVILLALVVPPAGAQLPDPQVTPSAPNVSEGDREVVLTLSKSTPGRVVYRTQDGSCGISSDSCGPPARAPEDYSAVSGELVFTEPGSKRITIPIVDDDLAEGYYEAFSFEAYEGDAAAGWPTGRFVEVRIHDEDNPDLCYYPPCASDDAGEPAAATTTTATTGGGRRPGSAAVPALPPARSPVGVGGVPVPLTTTTTRAPLPDLEVELASGDLRAGSGFELVSDRPPQSAPGNGGGDGGSAPWLALGLGSGAVTAGGVVVWVRRQRRWSSTRP